LHEYEHTQTGTLMWSIFGSGTIIAGSIVVLPAFNDSSVVHIPITVATIFVVCLFLFHSLTVTVSRENIVLRFGIGLIWKRFSVIDIQEATIVRDHWYYGWGIRLTPHGWLFNVSGFDAVEIQLKNGRKYRIGTDKPVDLLSAVKAVTANSG
jgi:hypothetical protein